MGVTGMQPQAIGEFLATWLTDQPRLTYQDNLGSAAALKLATDDLKAFYYEAKSVQPGRHSPTEVLHWFWLETIAGRVFIALRDKAAASTDPTMKGLATLSLVPRAVNDALKARAGS